MDKLFAARAYYRYSLDPDVEGFASWLADDMPILSASAVSNVVEYVSSIAVIRVPSIRDVARGLGGLLSESGQQALAHCRHALAAMDKLGFKADFQYSFFRVRFFQIACLSGISIFRVLH